MSRRCSRRGLTLYEIVLALSIMVIAMAVLSDLIATGSRAGSQAKLRTEAMLHAQTKMAEVIAGVEPLSAVQNSPIDTTDGGWTWGLEIGQGPHADLLTLTVSVSHESASSTVRQRQIDTTVSLSRCIRNPVIYEEAAAQVEAEAQEEAARSGTEETQ